MSDKGLKAASNKGTRSPTFGAPALILLTLTSACGGGSSESDAGPTSIPPVSLPQQETVEPTVLPTVVPPLATGPMHGFLTVEERSGKRVLDAWFVAEPVALEQQSAVSVSNNALNADFCQPVSSNQPASLFRGSSARAADAIELVSRSGVQARLNYFISSDAVVYAPEQRWLREPLADDTQLNLIGNPQLQSLTPPMLSPVKPIELNLPRRPVLTSASTSITWEPSEHPDDQIILTAWPKSRSAVTSDQPTLECTLEDDGQFTLAESVPATATFTDSTFGFRLRRERRTEHQVDDMGWTIVQSSLAEF